MMYNGGCYIRLKRAVIYSLFRQSEKRFWRFVQFGQESCPAGEYLHSERLWILEKVSAALKTTPTTIPQTPHNSKNPQKKKNVLVTTNTLAGKTMDLLYLSIDYSRTAKTGDPDVSRYLRNNLHLINNHACSLKVVQPSRLTAIGARSFLTRQNSLPIRGRVDRASSTEMVDSGSIPGGVKPKTIKIGIHSFPA